MLVSASDKEKMPTPTPSRVLLLLENYPLEVFIACDLLLYNMYLMRTKKTHSDFKVITSRSFASRQASNSNKGNAKDQSIDLFDRLISVGGYKLHGMDHSASSWS
jgi:hypothetical protein